MMPAARNEQTFSGTLDDVDSAPQETHRIAYLVDLDGEVRCEREIGIVLLVDSLDAIQSEVWCQLAASHIIEQEGELRWEQSPSVERLPRVTKSHHQESERVTFCGRRCWQTSCRNAARRHAWASTSPSAPDTQIDSLQSATHLPLHPQYRLTRCVRSSFESVTDRRRWSTRVVRCGVRSMDSANPLESTPGRCRTRGTTDCVISE